MHINQSTKKQPFLSAIFNRVIIILGVAVLTTGMLSFMPQPLSEPYIDMQVLIDNPKLKRAEAVVAPFLDGKPTTRILVDLLPARRGPRPGFNNMAVREQLVQDVSNYLDMVISKLDGNQIRITYRWTYMFGFAAEVTQQGLQTLLNTPEVIAIYEDAILKPHTNQGIPLMNATTVRNTYNGSGMAIAICDTGIDYYHPRLGGANLQHLGGTNTKVIGGTDVGEGDTDPMDEGNHGTACAGIAAGDLGTVGDYIGGVAHNAKLYAVKISNAPNHTASTAAMIAGWEWCITHQNDDGSNPIMIISTSFGGGYYTSNCDITVPSMTLAAANCKTAGMTLFVSSGNDGFCNGMGWPACISHVVSVGAVFDAAYGHYGWCLHTSTCAPLSLLFTCSGPAPYTHEADQVTAADLVTVYSNTASFLTLLAPSNAAYTTDRVGAPGYTTGNYTTNFGGTSAACPYAAGAAACLQSAAFATNGSFLPPDTVEYFLTSTGDPITDGKVAITKPRINLGNAFGGLTPVAVSDFKVTTDSGQSVVQWRTSAESGTIGFYLLRKGPKDKTYKRVNKRILMGLLTAPQGGQYSLVDGDAVHGEVYQYKLVEVAARGVRRTYGPFSVAAGQTGITPSSAGTLKYLKKHKPSHTLAQLRGSSGRKGHPRSAWKRARLRALKRAKKNFKRLRLKGVKGKAKITIKEEGLYLIRAADIANILGVHPFQVKMMIRSNRLQLTNRGKGVSWLAAGSGSGIYFYGEKINNLYTNENVYWLKKGRGRQMRFINGGHPVPTGGGTFTDTSHIEQEKYALTALFDNASDDYWLWDVIIGGQAGKSFSFLLNNVSASGDPLLTVNLKGATDTAHAVKVKLNGSNIGESSWQGIESHQFTVDIDPSLLKSGKNKIEVTGLLPTDTPFTIFYVDSFDLKYRRFYRAFNNKLFCRGDANRVITVEGFINRNIMVFDVTNSRNPKVVTGTTIDLQNRVSFKPRGVNRRYLVVGGGAVSLPLSVEGSGPFKLKRKNGSADYIVIVPEGFEQTAQDLVYLRQRSGFSPMIVGLEDIYNQFNHGISEPVAIKNFLTHVYHNWSGGDQRYVVLAGEGTYDYKDHLGYGENLIPPLMVSTPHGIFSADNQYGDVVDNDSVPEFVVGRLPVATAEELKSYIRKLTAYENSSGDWTGRVLMVADNQDSGGNFPYDSDRLAQQVSGYDVEKIYLSHFPDVDQAREKLFARINQGAALINYVGHAGLNKFAQEGWLELDDLSYLQNGNTLPVMTAMTCVSGRFSLPGFDTLGEALVLKENGGVIAVLSPSGFSQNFQANALAQQLFNAIFSDGHKIFGEAVLRAISNYRQNGGPAYLVNIYNILGDPAVTIK